MNGITWEAVGSIAAAVGVIMAIHAAIISLVVDRAIVRAVLKINQDFITRREFETHVKRCPHTRGPE